MRRFQDSYLVALAAGDILRSLIEYVDADHPRTAADRARHQRAQEALALADRGPQPAPIVQEMSERVRKIEKHERSHA